MDKKVYPSVEELTKIKTSVPCSDGCGGIFSSESNLLLHLAKTHKKEHLLKTEKNLEYYCPELSCIYNKEKHFKSMKHLKQHFLKVHAQKNFSCTQCDKSFSTQAARNSHVEYCGITFKCCDCEASYPSYESLITHARRKKHTILEKPKYKKEGTIHLLNEKCTSGTKLVPRTKNQLILPKGSISLQIIEPSSISKITADKSNQTENSQKYPVLSDSQNDFREVQKTLSSQETQTIGDYISRKNSLDLTSGSDDSLSKKSIKTQTKPVSSTTKSCNTSFNLNDIDFGSDPNVQRNSSSTQTMTSIPTEFIYSTMECSKDMKFEMEPLDISDSFFNCNSETQTEPLFGSDLMTPDYYTHMYTQTCDDILLSDLAFNNIHTQTVLDEMLRSVESQTMLSQNTETIMAHMETQTV